MRIAVIGGGFIGLTAAYRLSQKGQKVVLFEKEKTLGGLSAGFKPASPAGGKKNWDWYLESFFHHLFPSDSAVQNLTSELGLAKKLFYTRPKTSIYYCGRRHLGRWQADPEWSRGRSHDSSEVNIFQFDSPLSLLSFPHLNFLEKLRTGLITFYLKSKNNWKSFENITAFSWLKKYYGKKSFEILWKPLLLSKFGDQAKNISMSWFWARIKKRSAKLGYLEGGFQILVNELVKKIKENGGEIHLNHEFTCSNDSNHDNKFDRIIFTVSTPVFLKIAPELPKEYKKSLQKLKMIGALNLILILKEKFLADGTYWLNINEPGFPFVAVVEQTNFVDKKFYGENHIVYVGGYYPQNHRYFKMTRKQIFKEFLPYLQKISPNYQLLITNYYLFKNQFAQPIVPVNYSQLLPPHQTPIPGVFLANMQQVYPWDRGINYAIKEGEKIANEIQNS